MSLASSHLAKNHKCQPHSDNGQKVRGSKPIEILSGGPQTSVQRFMAVHSTVSETSVGTKVVESSTLLTLEQCRQCGLVFILLFSFAL